MNKEFELYNMVNASLKKLLPMRDVFIKVSAPTWISTAAWFTVCLASVELYHRCLQLRESLLKRTEWKELITGDKIIRPAYRNVHETVDYVPLNSR